MENRPLPQWIYTAWWITRTAWMQAITRWLAFWLGFVIGLDAGVRLALWAAG